MRERVELSHNQFSSRINTPPLVRGNEFSAAIKTVSLSRQRSTDQRNGYAEDLEFNIDPDELEQNPVLSFVVNEINQYDQSIPSIDQKTVRAEEDELMGEGATSIYLREMARYPLLTAEEEVQLAQQLELGKSALEQLLDSSLDDDQRMELEDIIQKGQLARNRLTESNLRLVVSVARKYLGRGLSFLDLVQEGNIGLQRGVEKYDWRKGFRFSTYAYWWIRQSVSRSIADKARIIRLPVHKIEQITHLSRVARELEHDLERSPTPAEIGEQVGISAERVTEIFNSSRLPLPLGKVIAGEGEEAITLDTILVDPNENPEKEAIDNILKQTLDRSLADRLSTREVDVLRLRYGLKDNRERTLAEVGRELGISRERVRQLEVEAMRKLRRDLSFRDEVRDVI